MISAFLIVWAGVALYVFARFRLKKNAHYRPFTFLKLLGVTFILLGLINLARGYFNV